MDSSRPFTAPVYLTYSECIKGLYNQGLSAFYKGNGVRSFHFCSLFFMQWIPLAFLTYYDNYAQYQMPVSLKYTFAYLILAAGDFCSYPLQMMQNRFILQNNLKTFNTYTVKSIVQRMINSGTQYPYRGLFGILPVNFCNLLRYKLVVSDVEGISFTNFSILASALSYPITTAMRRIQCQSDDIGMIPKRYSGVLHGMKLIYNEEGRKGLYRGFCANASAQLIGLGLLRVVHQWQTNIKKE